MAASLVVWLWSWAALLGQTPGTGAISGIVYDPAGKVVSNASVEARDESTRVARSVTTTQEGLFRVPLLPPGSYTVSVTAQGYAVNTSQPIRVVVSETSSLSITLARASTSASVLVAFAWIAGMPTSSRIM